MGGVLCEFYVLCLDWVKVVFGVEGWLEVFDYIVGGCMVWLVFCIDIGIVLVWYLKLFYLFNDYYGFVFVEVV